MTNSCEEQTSAAGAILNSRNPAYQAVYTVQGVTDNVHDLNINQLIQKPMFRDLIHILGTGIGKDFDINKLKYNKIIIATDMDCDGFNITSLLLCFFFVFMPQLIESGKIYKAMPPLYLMDMKSIKKYHNGREFLYDKNEYYAMINNIIANNVEIAIEDPKTSNTKSMKAIPMSKNETIKWLQMNSEYKIELDNLGKKSGSSSAIPEIVCYLRSNTKSETAFTKKIAEIYPEMSYDPYKKSLVGSYNMEHFSLICDSLFMKDAQRFLDVMTLNKSLYVWYRQKNTNDKFTRATIGEFFNEMEKVFNVRIDQRFKGLGEADAHLLFKSATNPKFRKLLQISMKDFDDTKSLFELLHGKSAKLRESRREFLNNTHLSYADIDN